MTTLDFRTAIVFCLSITVFFYHGGFANANEQEYDKKHVYWFLVDRSNSMKDILPGWGRSKMAEVQNQASELVDVMPLGSDVRILLFDTELRELTNNTLVDDVTRKAVKLSVSKMSHRNSETHLWRHLDTVLGMAGQFCEKNPNTVLQLFVLSDGQDNDKNYRLSPQEVVAKHVNVLSNSVRPVIVTIGYQMEGKTKAVLESHSVEVREAITKNDLFPVIASFEHFPKSPRAGEEMILFDTSIGSANKWEWKVDGRSLFGRVQPVRFATPGSHQVILHVFDVRGNAHTIKRSVEVTGATQSKAAFRVVGEHFVSGREIIFVNDTESSSPVRYDWKFGDGSSSTSKNPTHGFRVPGEYTVKLMVIGEDNQSSICESKIVVHQPSSPDVDFWAPQEIEAGQGFALIDRTSSDEAVQAYLWKVDGEIVSHERDFPGFSIAKPGEYTLTHVVKGAHGDAEKSRKILVKPAPVKKPDAQFAAPKTVSLRHEFNAFNRTDPSEGAEFQWLVGHRAVARTKDLAAYQFETEGKYQVTLIAKNSAGESKRSIEVEVLPTRPPVVNFALPTSAEAGVAFDMIDATVSDLPVTKSSWVVDDKELALNLDQVRHSFDAPGVYTVKRLITNADGTFDAERKITISPKRLPVAEFIVPESVVVGREFRIHSRSLNADRVEWRVNGEPAGQQRDLVRTEHKPGSLKIQLIVHGNGEVAQAEQEIKVQPKRLPVADFIVPESVLAGREIRIFGRSLDAERLEWFLDGKLVGRERDLLLTSQEPGLRKIRLVVHGNGETAQTEQEITVVTPPLPIPPVAGFVCPEKVWVGEPFTLYCCAENATEVTYTIGNQKMTGRDCKFTLGEVGTFRVIQAVTNHGGEDVLEKEIVVSAFNPPSVEIVAPDSILAGQDIRFIGRTFHADRLEWFSDETLLGSEMDLCAAFPAGRHLIKLIAYGKGGDVCVEKEIFVTDHPAPIADFWAPTSVRLGESVEIIGRQKNATSVSYDIDGQKITTPDYTFIPEKTGTILVTQMLVGRGGESSLEKKIIVVPREVRLNAALSVGLQSPLVSQAITFADVSSGRYVKAIVDFGDGTQSIVKPQETVTHAYDKPGQYIASLSISDDQDNYSRKEATVVVKDRPSVVAQNIYWIFAAVIGMSLAGICVAVKARSIIDEKFRRQLVGQMDYRPVGDDFWTSVDVYSPDGRCPVALDEQNTIVLTKTIDATKAETYAFELLSDERSVDQGGFELSETQQTGGFEFRFS